MPAPGPTTAGAASTRTGRSTCEGIARKVVWRNPHAEFDLEIAADLALPADLASGTLPAQSASVDGAALLAERAAADAQGPRLAHRARAADAHRGLEGRRDASNGDRVDMLGYTTTGEKGEPVLRAEYLFVAGNAYGLRSSPA